MAMPEYLVFRLYGPLASWGGIAVGEYRPVEPSPTKSAILGLVGAALGVRRDDAAAQAQLRRDYLVASIVHGGGTLLRDYHTTQVAPERAKKRYWRFATRREELSVPRDELNTILSTREYFCDALYTVCLRAATADPIYSLAEIAEGLRQPAFVPYLGRKSCPVALPFQPRVVAGSTLREALEAVTFHDRDLLRSRPGGKPEERAIGMLYWEGDEETGFAAEARYTKPRRDLPIDRMKWQFIERDEHAARIEIPAGVQ